MPLRFLPQFTNALVKQLCIIVVPICLLAPPAFADVTRQANIDAVRAQISELKRFKVSALYDEDDGPELLYVGTSHTFDPTSPQIEGIELLFNKFAPTLVLIEGGDWPIAANKEQAIKRYSEMGFTRFLAASANINAKSADATTEEEVRFALKHHAPSDLKLYYAIRMVPLWAKQETNLTMDEHMTKFLKSANLTDGFPPDTKPRNITEFEQLCAARLPALKDWRSVKDELVFDGVKQNLMFEIATTVSKFREDYFEQQILAGLRKGERVFIITGINHLARLYPRFQDKLRVLAQKNNVIAPK